MPKVKYDGITFDSELEIEYYKHLKEQNLKFIYHPKKPIHINSKNNYYPDFIVYYDDRIEIVECKGYSQFSFLKDNMIHNFMVEMYLDQKIDFLIENGILQEEIIGKDVAYRKIKYLKTYGWVDFDFKNPNTLSNQRKNKIIELEQEIKDNKEYRKNVERYFGYLRNIKNGKKLTKAQIEWKNKFERENDL